MKKLILMTLLFAGLMCQAQDKETVVVIETNYGTIKAKLYNDTPLHRDNFIKLINEGWYNGSPFHRVINKFMIQGGQNADGRQDPGYTVPAEFRSNHFHKKGALCAARQADQATPEDTVKWFRTIHSTFEKYGISRSAWSYKQMDFGLSDSRLDGVRGELISLL